MITDTAPPEQRARSLAASRPLLVTASVVGLVVVGWAGLAMARGGDIPGGTTVGGVDIGGRSPARARATLERELGDDAARPVAVRVGDARDTVSPADAGLSLDVAATVDAARTSRWNPVALVASLGGGGAVEPVRRVDEIRLGRALDALATRVDRAPTEGSLTVAGTGLRTTLPSQGRTLRKAAAAAALRAGYLGSTTPVVLPARVREPNVTRAEFERAVREVGTPALSAPVSVQVGGTTVELAPADIGRALTFVPDSSHQLQPHLDGARLHAAIASDLAEIETPARDATFRIVGGRPQVVPAKPGKGVDPTALAAGVLPALTTTPRTATVALGVTQPALTTEAAAKLGVTELVSAYTTFYPSDFAPRLTNIHRAADLMDNSLVLPGKQFSLNRTVGERTEARGFAAGFIINGGKLEVDFGGGVSQLTTTTFNAAYFAGLQIVEHHPHSFYISRYPEGREATVAWGAKDLRIRNDSGHGMFITTSWTSSSVSVRIWGTKRYRIESRKSARYAVKPFTTVYDSRQAGTNLGGCVATEGVPGFKVDVTRVFFQRGAQVKTEKFHTDYDPENKVVCGRSGPPQAPSASPTPTPSPSR